MQGAPAQRANHDHHPPHRRDPTARRHLGPRPRPALPTTGGCPDYGLYLGGGRLRRRHQPRLDWPHDWIDWPDFLPPRDQQQAVERIHQLREHACAGRAVEAACGGGGGRIGTVIACLAVLAGLPPAEAIAWTRANHHRAVETPWQRRWVERFPLHPTQKDHTTTDNDLMSRRRRRHRLMT